MFYTLLLRKILLAKIVNFLNRSSDVVLLNFSNGYNQAASFEALEPQNRSKTNNLLLDKCARTLKGHRKRGWRGHNAYHSMRLVFGANTFTGRTVSSGKLKELLLQLGLTATWPVACSDWMT